MASDLEKSKSKEVIDLFEQVKLLGYQFSLDELEGMDSDQAKSYLEEILKLKLAPTQKT